MPNISQDAEASTTPPRPPRAAGHHSVQSKNEVENEGEEAGWKFHRVERSSNWASRALPGPTGGGQTGN